MTNYNVILLWHAVGVAIADTYGVARSAEVIDVRVLNNDGDGTVE